jgi:RNA-directed DNA polymerase
MSQYEEVKDFVNQGLLIWAKDNGVEDEPQVELGQLHRLHKQLATAYVSFEIPKKSGGMRLIEAPNSTLKFVQRGIKAKLESLFTSELGAHGFVPGRGIKSNAAEHVGKKWVLNLDIAGFFPSVKKGRVEAVLQLEPFFVSELAARMIADFCTRNRALPQGSPSSPTITNIIARRLDRKLQSLGNHYNCSYTRYADDITFAGESKSLMEHILRKAESILRDEGFEIQSSKTRIQPASFRQEVTGLIVNEKVNTSRKYRRRLRATLHTMESKGISVAVEQANCQNEYQFLATLQGRIQHAVHIQPTPEVMRYKDRFMELKANIS